MTRALRGRRGKGWGSWPCKTEGSSHAARRRRRPTARRSRRLSPDRRPGQRRGPPRLLRARPSRHGGWWRGTWRKPGSTSGGIRSATSSACRRATVRASSSGAIPTPSRRAGWLDGIYGVAVGLAVARAAPGGGRPEGRRGVVPGRGRRLRLADGQPLVDRRLPDGGPARGGQIRTAGGSAPARRGAGNPGGRSRSSPSGSPASWRRISSRGRCCMRPARRSAWSPRSSGRATTR